MNSFNIAYLIFAIIVIGIRAFLDFQKNKEKRKIIDAFEKNQPTYNEFKVLPFDVQPLQILYSEAGLIRLVFTPTIFQQVDEFIFSINLKAKHPNGDIGFELLLNSTPQKGKNEKTGKEWFFNILLLNTHSDFADRFLRVLANLFSIEFGNKSQIVRELYLVTEEQKITSNSLHNGQEVFAYFADKPSSISIPAIRLEINLNKGEIFLDELDPIFRPIIIDRLTFKPNIKS